MTDQEFVELVLAEARAMTAVVASRERYDVDPGPSAFATGARLLREWNEARAVLRAAVMERLESEMLTERESA